MSKVRAVGRVAALAGMLVASAGVFAGVSHADSDDGDNGRGGTGHAKCKRGFLGLPTGNQCNSRNGARGGSDDEGDENPRHVSRSRGESRGEEKSRGERAGNAGDEKTREELADDAGGEKTRANLERERDRDDEAGRDEAGNRHGRAGTAGNARRIGPLERDRPKRKPFVAGSRGSYTNVYDSARDSGAGLYDGSAY